MSFLLDVQVNGMEKWVSGRFHESGLSVRTQGAVEHCTCNCQLHLLSLSVQTQWLPHNPDLLRCLAAG